MLKQRDHVFLKIDALEWLKIKLSDLKMKEISDFKAGTSLLQKKS